MPPDVDQRSEPEGRRSVIIHDDIGINIDNGRFVPHAGGFMDPLPSGP
jgi:hypothetical protein